MIRSRFVFSFFFVIFSLILCGCMTKDVTTRPEFSSVVGSCKRLKQDAFLGYHARFNEYHLDPNYHDYYQRKPEAVIEYLPAYSRFEVVKIFHESLGEGGYCWGVKVKILDGVHKGTVAKIPACFTENVPLWINLRFIEDANKNALQIKDDFAVDCKK